MSMSQAAKDLYDSIKINRTQLNDDVGSGIFSATVETVKPLSIRIDARKLVTEDFIALSPMCVRAEFDNYRETYLKEGGAGDAEFASHSHKFHVGLWRGLKVGDQVLVIMSSDKQTYYISHRIGMIFGDMAE